MKIVEWDYINHIENKPQKEIKSGTVAVIVSDRERYYIQIEDGVIKIMKTGFNSEQISVLPNSSNVVFIK